MPDNLQKKKNDKNKVQWHFKRSKSERGYELNDPDIHTDVLGSYTGTPYDGVQPVQDVDDL